VSTVLENWNKADEGAALNTMLACCGAKRWATEMVALRPIKDVTELSELADRVWSTMQEPDWLEAFACHPRIGERKAAHAGSRSTAWSQQEQSRASAAGESVLTELAEGNQLYEERFGFTYIVCATGKSAEEMLGILERRLAATRDTELREAAEQQRQIMQIRLGKWLTE
jgi:2-oxo-4-hydroxy-4-carboxy-5-ureidoimidazoline decarboxylase